MTTNPEFALLQGLSDCEPFLTLESTVYAETCNRLTRSFTYNDFRELLAKTKDKRRIESVSAEDGLKWKITEAGHLRLRELQ